MFLSYAVTSVMDVLLILDALLKHCTISLPFFHATWDIEF